MFHKACREVFFLFESVNLMWVHESSFAMKKKKNWAFSNKKKHKMIDKMIRFGW